MKNSSSSSLHTLNEQTIGRQIEDGMTSMERTSSLHTGGLEFNSEFNNNNLSIVEMDQMIEHFKKQISYLEKQKERKITAMCGKSVGGGSNERNFSMVRTYIQKILPSAFSESRFYNLFMVELLEMLITQTVVLFGVVCFWRGIWGLSDHYLGVANENSILRLGWTTLLIGVVVSFITQMGSVLVTRLGILNLLVSVFESDSKMETAQASYSAERGASQGGKKNPSLWIRISMKLYTYIVAISIILCWKGSWMVMDGYFEKWFKNAFVTNWISHIIAALVLIWFSTFRSVLSPASMDRENHFESLIVSKWSGMSRPLVKEWAKSFISKNKDFTENA